MPSSSDFDDDLHCVEEVFPSMFRALARLSGDDFEAGWLIGCLQDVVACLITAMTRNHPCAPKCLPLYPEQVLALRYLREVAPDEERAPHGIIERIKMDELIELVRLICADYEIERLSGPAIPSLNHTDYQWRIDAVEDRFERMMTRAMLEYLHSGDEEDAYAGEMITGYNAEVLDPWLKGPPTPAVQFLPDGTPVEVVPAGSPVPCLMYCLPYQGTQLPQGQCIICMDQLADLTNGSLVVARCHAGHIFHTACLDLWVNGSSMGNANTCPHDREQICEPRARLHPGLVPLEFDTEEEEPWFRSVLRIPPWDMVDSDSDDEDSDEEDEDEDEMEEDGLNIPDELNGEDEDMGAFEGESME
ncbi:hypothetical protein N0V90_010828 [Kalmusia sp. IMI 367209]|nr:hypothetical protein N0V90_010828 [Kalmusia sp. IMI 367209]